MAHWAVDGVRPAFVTRGMAQTRRLRVFTEAGSEGSYSGTYTLYAPDGSQVSGATGITVTSSTTASFTPSASIEPGSRYVEEWTLTIESVSRKYRIACIVQTWTLADDELLVMPLHILAMYPGMTQYPAGTTSWLEACDVATCAVLTDYVRLVPLIGQQVADRGALTWLAVHKALEWIARQMARNGNPGALEMAAYHAAEYRDGWANFRAAVDTDADGVPDAEARLADQPGFPPPAPLG